jgi:hypothetical protein
LDAIACRSPADLSRVTGRMTSNMSQIISDYELLDKEVSSLHLYWNVFNSLYKKNKYRTDLMEKLADGFFGMLYQVLVDSILLGLSKLSDPIQSCGKDNLVIKRIFEAMRDGQLLDTNSLNQLTTKIDEIKSLREKINDHRNMRIAHCDYRLANRSHSLPDVTFEELGRMLKALCEYMNLTASILHQTPTNYSEVKFLCDDYEMIISQLRIADAYRDLEESHHVTRMITIPEPVE